MNWLLSNIKSDPVDWIALLIGVLNLGLYFRSFWKERIQLKIRQVSSDDAYYFHYVWHERYDCMFFQIAVTNPSKSETSVSNITVADKYGNTYAPISFDKQLPSVDGDGIALHKLGDTGRAMQYKLTTQNFLNDLRIESMGSLDGFLYFENIIELHEEVECVKLIIETPAKSFSKEITVRKLPESIFPVDGVHAHQQFD